MVVASIFPVYSFLFSTWQTILSFIYLCNSGSGLDWRQPKLMAVDLVVRPSREQCQTRAYHSTRNSYDTRVVGSNVSIINMSVQKTSLTCGNISRRYHNNNRTVGPEPHYFFLHCQVRVPTISFCLSKPPSFDCCSAKSNNVARNYRVLLEKRRKRFLTNLGADVS